jgi:hypothetical protein
MKTREQAVAEKGAWGNADTMSDNPLDELQGGISEAWTVAEELQGDISKDSGMAELTKPHYAWTLVDEAIHRSNNYAEANLEIVATLRREEGMTMYAVLKNAYETGFLNGFEHKFDQTNYEEK